MKSNDSVPHNFLTFLQQCPTAWHAIHETSNQLKAKGFKELKETDRWNIQSNEKYFVTRNGSSICAFITPSSAPQKARVVASHSDSPGFKLKPQPEIRKHNMILLGVEIYGAPLLSSWLNRDLGIAGRVIYYDKEDQLQTSLVRLDDDPLTIPQLAIHLDREVNEKGLILNKQEHLNALAALIDENEKVGNYLETLLRKQIEFKQLISSDLFLYPLEAPRLLGYKGQFVAAYRLDNLASLHSSLQAFLENTDPLDHEIKMLICWDHEEIGSNTAQGASSPFFSSILERILISFKLTREDFFRVTNDSLCISVDLAHALHPNYNDKHDVNHPILMQKGVVLKSNAQHRYASDAFSSLAIYKAANQTNIPLQKFVSRNDIPCGTTIGPIYASTNGMPTVDIGCGQLSMHSSRELMSIADYLHLFNLIKCYYHQ